MRLCLVEDAAVSGLEPLTLTRPVHELLLGATTLSSKITRAFKVDPGPHRRSCVIRSHLVAAQRHRDSHLVVNDRDWLARAPVMVANSRWVPPERFRVAGGKRPVGRAVRWAAGLRAGRAEGCRGARAAWCRFVV